MSQGDGHWGMGNFPPPPPSPPIVGQGMRVSHPHRESSGTRANLPISGREVRDELCQEEPPAQFISCAYFWVGLAWVTDVTGEHCPARIKADTSRGEAGTGEMACKGGALYAERRQHRHTAEEPAEREERRSSAGGRTQSDVEGWLKHKA